MGISFIYLENCSAADKGELGPQLGPELLKLTKQMVETHHIQLKPSEQQVHDVFFFVAR